MASQAAMNFSVRAIPPSGQIQNRCVGDTQADGGAQVGCESRKGSGYAVATCHLVERGNWIFVVADVVGLNRSEDVTGAAQRPGHLRPGAAWHRDR